jgi:DNA-binding CsgD family transcriptional regulator
MVERGRKHVTARQVELYKTGELNADEAEIVDKHIRICSKCSTLVSQAKATADSSASGVPGVLWSLTPREREIALCVADGLSTKQIAGVLDISPRTVDLHRKAINKKLGVESAAMLTRILIRAGIISP